MALDKITYAAARKYTDNSIAGGGISAGKNCVITDISPITGGNRVTFQWTLDNGTIQTGTMDVMNGIDGQDGATGAQGPQGPAGADGQDGADGLGIKSVEVNSEDHLIITYDDDTTEDAGAISVTAAVDSVNGQTGEVTLTASDIGALPDDTTIPSKLSELTNDSNFVADADYVHTDNNYDNASKSAVDSLKSASTKDTTTFISPGNHDIPDADATYKAMTSMLEGAFHPAGNKTVAELTSALLIQANVGNVYKITDNGTTDANWVGGAGQTITAGQMAVVVYGNAAGTFLFNLENGINIDLSAYQTKLLSAPIPVDGTAKNNVEDALSAINTLAAANKTAVGNIKDGTTIDSFSDVETALSGKADASDIPDITVKADKVSGATNGNFAGLDANGNLTDSGKKAADFATPTDIAAQQTLLKDTVGWTKKNFAKKTNTIIIDNGLTFTDNPDGTITANGTPTGGNATYFLTSKNTNWNYRSGIVDYLPIGKYKLSNIGTGATKIDNVFIGFNVYDSSDNTVISLSVSGTEEIEFEVTQSGLSYVLYLRVADEVTVSDYKFYPMIRKADISDSTYEPYHDSVETMYEEEIHGVNLFKTTGGTQTVNGITFTRNYNDDTWTINGTATANTYPILGWVNGGKLKAPTIISQGNVVDIGCRIYLNAYKNGTYTFNVMTATPGQSEQIVDIPSNDDYDSIAFGFNIPNGTTINNLTLKPMLRKAEIEDSTYRPFNKQSIQNQLNVHSGILGSRNLVPNTYKDRTENGLTFTVNSDGSVTVNGTATDRYNFVTLLTQTDLNGYGKQRYKASGCPKGGTSSTYFMYVHPGRHNDVWDPAVFDYGDGVEFDYDGATKVYYAITIMSGVTVNNLTFYPMIRLASDPDDTYQPYARSNRQLTDEGPIVINHEIVWNSDLNLGTSKGGQLYQWGRLYFVSYWFKATTALTGNTPILKLPKKNLVIGNYVITEDNDTAVWGGRATKDNEDYVSISCPIVVDKTYRCQCVCIDVL